MEKMENDLNTQKGFKMLDKNKIKEILHQISIKFQKAGFWVLFLILIGMSLGANIASKIYDIRAQDAVKLQGIIIDNKVYDLKLRP